jgi:hypothetical protein
MGLVTPDRRIQIAALILGLATTGAAPRVATAEAEKGDEGRSVATNIAQWRSVVPSRPYVCWRKESPWIGLDRLQPPPEEFADLQTITLDMGRNEYESTSFVLTNLSEAPLEFQLACEDSPAGISATLRQAVWVIVDDGSQVNDALSLIDNDTIVLPSGESREIWVTLQTKGAAAGQYKQAINVMPNGLAPQTVEISVTIHDVSLPETLPLDIFHFDELVTTNMETELVEASMTDLRTHYVNHAFVHPVVLPRLGVDAKGKLLTDYTRFDKMIDDYKILDPKRYIFFWASESFLEPSGEWAPSHPESIGRPEFMTPAWKELFRDWLTDWVAHMKDRGLGYDEFVMHPYDERGGPKVQAMIKLIKEVDPNVLVLFNGGIGETEEHVANKIAPYIDAWMPFFYHYDGTGKVYGQAYQKVTVEPDSDYELSFYVKNAGSSLYFSLWFDGSTTRKAHSVDGADWRKFELKFSTESDTTMAHVGFYPTAGKKSLLIDDVILRKKSGANLVAGGDMESENLSANWSVSNASIAANSADAYSGDQCAEIIGQPKDTEFEMTIGKRLLGPEGGKFFWTYANPVGIDPGRASPYSAYRIPVWLAWREGMVGFSIWAYRPGRWSGAGKGSNWGMIYRRNQAECPPDVSRQEMVIPSKRWEACREGVEDYAYLHLLSQATRDASPEVGAKAKALLDSSVEKVLGDATNQLLADEAKKRLMEELVKISSQ